LSDHNRFTYTGRKLNEISFPLGGIGSGSISLAGNGRLIDWEIFNRPNKQNSNGFSFFAVKAEHQGEVRFAKVLNGDLHAPYSGLRSERFRGFGFGVERETMAGLPHFESTEFTGKYPFANVQFLDRKSPLDIQLTAFNPLIPLNDKDSSLPIAVFTFQVANHSEEELDVSLVGNLTNPAEKGARNDYFDKGSFSGIKLSSGAYEADDPKYGDLTLSTDGDDVSYQSYWYRGGWFDNLTVFWKEFLASGKFKERNYDELRGKAAVATYNNRDVCVLSSHRTLAPGESGTFRFMISWSFPNFVNFWNPGSASMGTGWQNYYATLFDDSMASATYAWSELDRLENESQLFKDTLFNTTMPDYVVDAIASNISILKSPTCVRLTDGTLYGFEGCHADEGCCEGSCTHVWNYEQVTPFLFPSLARSMRITEYNSAQFDTGKMSFRLMLPLVRTLSDVSDCAGPDRAAADGQMGGIIKTYREWKISGDSKWLRGIWPKVKNGLEYAWSPNNADWWDRDRDGVMEGVQHHTLDVEIYGPNTYITGQYHAALLAASEMAKALGDMEAAQTYVSIYENGKRWVDENLFNGEYFFQQIDLKDETFPVDPELGEIKYQIGDGCHIDQVIGQWHAHIVGLGYVFDSAKVRKSLESIYKFNFIECMREYSNACRIYALNDERGLLICTWPRDNCPKVPVPYADETMNGFEYQAACHMIYEGLIEEGLTVVQAIRDRYDGERRNPWNEFECGSNYARSMASYSLLLALSGFEYDMTRGMIGFNPRIEENSFRSFWSLHEGWGQFIHDAATGTIELQVKYGQLVLQRFQSGLLTGRMISGVYAGDEELQTAITNDAIVFANSVRFDAAKPLRIVLQK
jgi:non-lysosomal glucosylceramidase